MPGVYIASSYASVFVDEGVPGFDRTLYNAGLTYPAMKILTFETSYALDDDDSLYHRYTAGFRLRSADPLRAGASVNPDGRVGAPLLDFSFTGKFPDAESKAHRYWIDVSALVPVSEGLSIGGGMRYYEEENPRRVDEYFGLLNYFPVGYSTDAEYENPDGVEGYPSFYFAAGGSDNGYFGRLDIAMPIKPELTLTFMLRGEIVSDPDVKIAVAGGRISYYPGR